VLQELTGLTNVYLEQVKTFGKVNRHPRGRVVTVAYYSLVNINQVNPKPDSFAREVAWLKLSEIGSLAFDHYKIMRTCLKRLQEQVRTQPIGFELLPEKFTLSELQELYEAILETSLDKRNFRKKMMSLNVLIDNQEYQSGVAHRPAKLYAFDKEKFESAKQEGIHFEI
jgi:8-oxo-dGTP diphosphatase